MNISPSQVPGVVDSGSQAQDPSDFDQALLGAQQDLSDEEMKALVEGAVNFAGSMLIMPKANEILSDVMSDD